MYEFKVSGMTCNGCVKSVSNAIKLIDSSAVVNVDLNSQKIEVKSTHDKNEIADCIENAGFPVIES